MLKLLFLIAAAYAGLAAIVFFTADRQMFLPPPPSYRESDLPLVRIPTGDGGEIAAVHLPNPASRVTLVFSHGNAEDLGYLAPFLEALRDTAGVSVIAYDYRGYGRSSGPPASETSAYRDIEAVYGWAVETLRIPPGRIILHGRSVGSGPAVHLAATRPVGGLVIESGFTSAFVVVTRVPIFPFDKFTNLRRIAKVRCPVLVIHGAADEIIPPSHGRALFAAAPDPKRLAMVPGAGHNDLVSVAGEYYWRTLREFAAMVE